MEFKSLLEFVTYCESVDAESNDIWLLSMLASLSTQEEFLSDVRVCLDKYNMYLYEAVNLELYSWAGIIFTSMQLEMDHYKELAYAIFKKNLNTEIITIGEVLKNKYMNGK